MELIQTLVNYRDPYYIFSSISSIEGVVKPFTVDIFRLGDCSSHTTTSCLLEDFLRHRKVMTTDGAVVEIPFSVALQVAYFGKYTVVNQQKNFSKNLSYKEGRVDYGYWVYDQDYLDYVHKFSLSKSANSVDMSEENFFSMIDVPYISVEKNYHNSHTYIGNFKSVFVNLYHGLPILSSLCIDSREVYYHSSESNQNLKTFWEPFMGEINYFDDCDIYLAYGYSQKSLYEQMVEASQVLNKKSGLFAYYSEDGVKLPSNEFVHKRGRLTYKQLINLL